MTNNLKKITTVGLGVVLAIAIICCSAIALILGGKEADRGYMPRQSAEIGTAISNTSQLNDWLDKQETDAYLAANVEYNGTGSNKVISKVLDGNGYKITMTGEGDSSADGSHILGVFSRRITGTVKNVKFEYTGSIIQHVYMNCQYDDGGEIYLGLITGEVSEGGLIEDCTVSLNSRLKFNKKKPDARRPDQYMLAGLLAGNLMGTIRNTTINLNAMFDFDATGKRDIGSTGGSDYGYLATAVGHINKGQLLNTTVNVGDGGDLFADSEGGEFAAGVVAVMERNEAASLVDGVIINNAANFASSIFAWDGGDYLIVSNYDGGTIKNVYADDNMSNLQCDGQSRRPENSGNGHNAHTYLIGAGSKAIDFNVNNFNNAEIAFRAGDIDNIYYTDTTLTDADCVWAVKNTEDGSNVEVWEDYDIGSKSVGFAKRNASAINDISFENGAIKRGARFGFDNITLTYGDTNMPNVKMMYEDTVKAVDFDHTLDIPLTPNAYGYVNQGKYTINGVTERIGIVSEKTFYVDHVFDNDTKSLTINKKTVTMSINQDNNIYKATVSVQGLLSDEVLTFSDYQGVNFGASTSIPMQYLKSDRKLTFTRTLIPTDSNYTTDKTYEFVINNLVVSYESVITVTANQENITSGKVEVNPTAHTLTFKDNTVNSIILEAITDVYGLKYTGFEGTDTITSESTNGKLIATLAINGDVKRITVVGDVDTKKVSVSATTGGSATIDYDGVNNNKPKDVSLGDKFTLKAKVNSGYVFLGWTNTAGEYVSCEVNVSFFAKEEVNYKANFEKREESKTKVRISNLYKEGVVEFYTTLTNEAEILEYAKTTYLNDFNHEAYNDCIGFKVASSSANGFELIPIYTDSEASISIRIDGDRQEAVINQEIPLEAGTYVINNVKVTFTEKTVIYAVQGLDITTVAEDYDSVDLQDNAFSGEYNFEEGQEDRGYLNFTIASNAKLSGEVELTIRENGIAKYTAVVKYTVINDNIIQSIVNLPRKVFKDLAGEKTVTVTVNDVAVSGVITLN